MAIQPMALGVANPEINALGAFAEGQRARQQAENNSLVNARAAMQNIGSLAFGVMGGKLDGQADPALWEEALDTLGAAGMDVEAFRGRADLAPVVAKASADTLGQLNLAQSEAELQQRIEEFGLKVMEAAQGTTEQQNFTAAQADPEGFGAFLNAKDAPNPPANVGEYNFYAEQERAAGREPKSFEAYQAAQKGQGLTVQTNADGTTTVTQGGAPPKLTEGQSKDTGFLVRGRGANATLETTDTQLTNWLDKQAGGAPMDLGPFLQSPEYQGAEQAGLEFLAALLRKDSGGAITPDENATYGKIYLPQPGNPPSVIEQKRAARERAMDALEAGLPSNLIAILEEKGLLPEVLASSNPEAAATAVAAEPTAPAEIGEGTIIENDAGERMIMQNGQWVKQ